MIPNVLLRRRFCPTVAALSIALATLAAFAALAVSPVAHAELDGTMPDQSAVSAPIARSAALSATVGASGAAPTPTLSNQNTQNAESTLLNGTLRLRTLIDAGGTTINEYATSTGRIVAYTWAGPTMPDLRALLGKYSVSYRAGAAAATPDGNLHSSRIARPDVIVESGGPMRGYVGRAWLPNALPPGVTAADFQ